MPERVRRTDDGFSLVEMLAAIAVVMVVTTAVAVGLAASTSASSASKGRVVATGLAAQDLELTRSTRFPDLPIGGPVAVGTRVIDGVSYSVSRTVTWRSTISPIDRCSGGSTGRFAFKHVAVDVRWTSAGKVRGVTNETLIAPAAGEGEPDAGAQRVRVVDRDFKPVEGVRVDLVGGATSAWTTTDRWGCALFADLAGGNYTVTLTRAGFAFVDPQGRSAPTASVSVPPGGTETPAILEMRYDQAASISAVLRQPAGTSGYTVPSGLGATISNGSLPGNGSRTLPASGGSVVFPGLFPFRDDRYAVTAGSCAAATPANAVYPAVVPGQTASVDLPLANVYVRVKDGPGAPMVYENATMYAVRVDTTGCTAVTDPSMHPATSVGMALLVTTDGNGEMRVSLPYGRWTFAPANGSGEIYNSSSNTFDLDPTDPAAPGRVEIRVH